MKEATGELNMTIVVIIAIGILTAFFFTIIWPALNNNLAKNAKCSDAICKGESVNGEPNCTYYFKDKNGHAMEDKKVELVCPWKG